MNSSAPVFKRAGYFLMIIWLAFGAALLALLLCDAVLRSVLKAPKSARVDASVTAIAREAMAANGDERGYWNEHEAAKETQWRAYVYFRRKPFQGNYIHVDANGFRETQNIPTQLTPAPVWLFGGSTVWGTGVSDAHTLASLLVKTSEQALRVANFGETGYVSAQSQLAMMSALRCSDAQTPWAAVFVDGVNDVYSALQSNQAGLPQNESNRIAEFNMTRSASAFGNAVFERLEGLRLLRLRFDSAAQGAEIRQLAAQIAEQYLAVVSQSRAIAKANGIHALFVWQPSVFDKKAPSADEKAVIGASLREHRDLQLATTKALRALLRAQPAPDVLVLDDLFDANPEPIYLDFAHTGSKGNAILAARIWQELRAHPRPMQANSGPTKFCTARPVKF